uniref:Uncharacterized protein n=1 Tax=viral metagenome TaxID=1070528 RepID=A0A6C0BD59_9ZZZZ
MRNSIKNYQSSESPICPVYFCDQYTDPTTGYLEPGSLCYTNTSGSNNVMTAYRYTNSDQSTYECQKYLIENNLVINGQTYLPQSQL